MPIVVWNTENKGVYTMASQYIRHEEWAPDFGGRNGGSTSGLPAEGANYVVNVTSADDRYIAASGTQFLALLDAFGIPRDRIGSNAFVVPPGGTTGVKGARWSIGDEILYRMKENANA